MGGCRWYATALELRADENAATSLRPRPCWTGVLVWGLTLLAALDSLGLPLQWVVKGLGASTVVLGILAGHLALVSLVSPPFSSTWAP